MPDSPDYNRYLPNSTRFSLQDMGELAVRLGSPVVFDRRGEVVWYDDFRHGQIGWSNTLPGGTAAVSLGVRSSFLSPYCLRMLDSLIGTMVISTSKNITANASGKIGIELCFKLTAYFDTLDLTFSFNTTTYTIASKMQLKNTGSLIKLWNDSGAYTTISLSSQSLITSGLLHFMKFVIDSQTGEYVRVIWDSQTEIISTIQAVKTAGAYNPAISVGVSMLGNSVTPSDIDLLHVIVTSNEP